MALNIILTGVLETNGRQRSVVRGKLLSVTPGGTFTGFSWFDETGRAVTIESNDVLRIFTLTGSTDSGTSTVRLQDSDGVIVEVVSLSNSRTFYADYSPSPISLAPGKNLGVLAAVWLPDQISGLWGWWDFSSADDRVESGSDITGWLDRSGNTRTLAAATVAGVNDLAATTIGGLNGLNTPGGLAAFQTDYTLNEIDTGHVLVGFVGKMPSSGTNSRFVSTRDDAGVSWEALALNVNNLYAGLAAAGTWPQWSIGSGNEFILVLRLDFASAVPNTQMILARADGDLTDDEGSYTGSVYSPGNDRLGLFAQPNDGGIVSPLTGGGLGEVTLARRGSAFTVADVQQLEGYLAHKWSLESLLPAGHPYKASPP